jgi:hypothetical protein
MSRSIEERLDALQRDSELRREELREIAAALPAALSRKQLLRAIILDIRRAPRKGNLVRAMIDAAKNPRELYRSTASPPRARSQ